MLIGYKIICKRLVLRDIPWGVASLCLRPTMRIADKELRPAGRVVDLLKRGRNFMAVASKSDKPGVSENTLEEDVRQLQKDIKKLTELLSKTKQDSYSAASHAASEGLEQLRAQGDAAIDGLKQSAEDIEAQIVSAVREKPVTSLAIAAGVGFLFALISRR